MAMKFKVLDLDNLKFKSNYQLDPKDACWSMHQIQQETL